MAQLVVLSRAELRAVVERIEFVTQQTQQLIAGSSDRLRASRRLLNQTDDLMGIWRGRRPRLFGEPVVPPRLDRGDEATTPRPGMHEPWKFPARPPSVPAPTPRS